MADVTALVAAVVQTALDDLDAEALNRERDITVLMVTHEADMAAFARRIVRFVDGRIASDTRAAAVAA